jgi:type IV secretory pathway VirB4 component
LAAIYPFHGGHALADLSAPYVGVNVTDGGSAWCYDPFELYGRDLGAGVTMTNTNTLVLGEPGNGKSAFPKMVVWREAGFYGSRRFAAISDPKGEYGPLAEALGMSRVRLAPGGSERLNPLDPGPGDPAQSVLARQALLIGMLGLVLRRDLSNVEESMLAIAVERLDAAHRRRPATLRDLARFLGELPAELARHEHLSLLSPEAISESLTTLRVGLVKLLEHTLRGMFDGPSTVHIDWASGPGLVVDLSSVFDNTDALPLVQLTTNAWLSAQMAGLQHQGRRGILIEDEVWATTGSERAAKALQARLKLCRLYGIWNILITHRLSDLRAQADDGSSASKVAAELLGDVQTRVVFRQATDQLEETSRRLRLNDKQVELVSRLPPHRALWIVTGRAAVVHHVVADHELALTDTDQALAA